MLSLKENIIDFRELTNEKEWHSFRLGLRHIIDLFTRLNEDVDPRKEALLSGWVTPLQPLLGPVTS